MPAHTSILIRGVDDPRPESSLRFGAWRRIEVIRELKKYEDEIGPIDESQKKDALVQQAEAFIAMGRIPDPFKRRQIPSVDFEKLQADSKKVGRLETEAAERDAKIERLEAAVEKLLGGTDNADEGHEIVKPFDAEKWLPDVEKHGMDEKLEVLSVRSSKAKEWNDLRAKAKGMGIDVYGKKRPDLETEIQAKEAGI